MPGDSEHSSLQKNGINTNKYILVKVYCLLWLFRRFINRFEVKSTWWRNSSLQARDAWSRSSKRILKHRRKCACWFFGWQALLRGSIRWVSFDNPPHRTSEFWTLESDWNSGVAPVVTTATIYRNRSRSSIYPGKHENIQLKESQTGVIFTLVRSLVLIALSISYQR